MAKRTTHRKPGFTETVKTDGGRETYQNPETALKPSKDYEAASGEYSFPSRASSGLTAERVADMFARKAVVVSESRETIAGLRNLIRESVSENTLKAYCRALGRLVAFMGIESAEEVNIRLLLEKLDDVTLARYVAKIEAEGKAPAGSNGHSGGPLRGEALGTGISGWQDNGECDVRIPPQGRRTRTRPSAGCHLDAGGKNRGYGGRRSGFASRGPRRGFDLGHVRRDAENFGSGGPARLRRYRGNRRLRTGQRPQVKDGPGGPGDGSLSRPPDDDPGQGMARSRGPK